MTVHLTRGAHPTRADGMCAMEAAAYLAGEDHSDYPVCVSPVLGVFLRSWNDGLAPDAERDRLIKPLLPLVLHTATGGADDVTRAWLATDWLVRVHLPAWLDAAGLRDHAARVRALPPLTGPEVAVAVQATVAAAREAAREAAGDDACDGARTAAREAAGDAAGEAAWDAAGAPACAGAAARIAVRAVAWPAAGDAARAAAGDRLAPTVAALQTSAQRLVRDMAAVGIVLERGYRAARLAEVLAEEPPHGGGTCS